MATSTVTHVGARGPAEGREERFSATLAGAYNGAIALDLSAIFANVVLGVIVTNDGGLGHAYYVPGTSGDPATGRLAVRRHTTGTVYTIPTTALASGVGLTGITVSGIAVGY